MILKDVGELAAGILRPPIRVEYKFLGDGIRSCRHLPSGDNRILGAQCFSHRPPYHFSMEQVDDHGKVHPALLRPYVGDVRHPDLVLLGDRKFTVQYIRCDRIIMVAVGGANEFAFSSGEQIIGPHYPGHPGP